MSWPARCALLFALLLSACDDDAVLDPPTSVAPQAPLTVSATGGEVRIERGGVLLLPGSGMVPGDVLVTGEGGAAKLTLPDGREVEVGSNARILVGGEGGRVVLEVGRGVVLARIPEGMADGGEGVVLELKTPFGLTRLGAGDEAAVDGTTGRVAVHRGSVAFVSADGTVLELAEGQEADTSVEGKAVARAQEAQEVEAPSEVLTLRKREIVLRPARGVQMRSAGSPRWTAVGSQDVVLAAGDRVRAQRQAAELAVGGLGLSLEPGGELALGTSAQPDGPAEVTLTRGALILTSSGADGSRLSIGGVTLAPKEAGQARVRRGASGLEFDVVTGAFSLGKGAGQRELTGGTSARVADDGVIATSVREAPALRLPSVARQRVLHRDLEAFAVSWDHEGPVKVEVASDPAYRKLLLSGRVDAGFVTLSPPARGTLHWRVKDPAGTQVAFGSASFSPERKASTGGARTNEVPEGAQRTTIYFQSRQPGLTFVYAPLADAASYLVKVYREGELAKPVVERTVTASKLSLEPGVLDEGSYLWSATPLDAAGKALRGARMSRLELAYDNALPELVVESPRAGARVREGQEIRVAGVAPVGSRVRVNGKAVAQDAKGRFSGRVRASGSPACIIFELSRPGVPDTYTVRTLRTRT